MKKLLLLSSMILILASCSIGSDKTVTPTQNTPGNKDFQASIDTASSKIKNTEEFQSCMAPAVNSCISSVGMQLAQKSKDASFCAELPQKEQQEGCKFALVVGDASEKGDVSACNGLSGTYQQQCTKAIYRSLAMKNKDISYCGKMQEGSVSGEVNMAEQEYDQCVLSIVMSKENATATDCNVLKSKNMRNVCENTVKNRPSMREMPAR